jgi:hypothetical protein
LGSFCSISGNKIYADCFEQLWKATTKRSRTSAGSAMLRSIEAVESISRSKTAREFAMRAS